MSQTRRTPADEPFLLIRTVSATIPIGGDTGRHVHDWGQLIYCSAGVMTVWTEVGSWVAPPHWAIWVPPGVAHDIRFAGHAELRTLYLRADLGVELPSECVVLTVSALLRELILRTMELRMLDEREPIHAAMARLVLSELARLDRPPLDLPTPISRATRRAASLLTSGSSDVGTRALALTLGLSARTLERRFLSETGMSIASWGRQARLLDSLRLLAAGSSVKAAARAAGYRTPSAFVAAFRTVFGQTPARYFARTPESAR